MKNFPDLPPVWTALAICLHVLCGRFGPDFLGGFQSLWIAYGLIGAGVCLIGWSAYWFWARKTTIHPHHTPDVLLVEGPYRISRNPIYLGMVIICVGVVMYAGNLLGLVPAAGLVWVLHTRFVLPEEAALQAAFGDEGKAYVEKTRRW